MYLESNTPSAVIKSQEIDGLEEWLKKNKPTVIPPGVSLGEVKFVVDILPDLNPEVLRSNAINANMNMQQS